MNRFAIAVLCLLAAAPAAPAPAGAAAATKSKPAKSTAAKPSAASSSADVQAAVRAYVDAANRGDVEGMMAMFSHKGEVSSITDGVITKGWDAIKEENDVITKNDSGVKLSLGAIDVVTLGASDALAVAPLGVTVTLQGHTYRADGALSLVLEKTSGKWLILHEHSSGQEPEGDQDINPGDEGDEDQGDPEGDNGSGSVGGPNPK